MKDSKKMKMTKYVVTSAVLMNTMAAPIAVFANESTSNFQKLIDAGIITGDQNGDLLLEKDMTRAQFATVLAKALKLDLSQKSSKFSDVSGDHWALGAISALEKVGIIVGDAKGFRPNDTISWEEFATILVRAYQIPVKSNGNNVNGNVSDWAKDYVAAAINAKLIPTSRDYKSPAKRESIISSTQEIYNTPEFEQIVENIKDLASEGKKVSNSDPSL